MRPYTRELFAVARIHDGEIACLEAGPFIDWNDAYDWLLSQEDYRNLEVVETEPLEWRPV